MFQNNTYFVKQGAKTGELKPVKLRYQAEMWVLRDLKNETKKWSDLSASFIGKKVRPQKGTRLEELIQAKL